MLIDKLEQKIKLALFVSLFSLLCSAIMVIFTVIKATNMVEKAKKNIYILDGNIPLTAQQTSQDVNLDIEAKAHVNLFHHFFFTLPPDDEYIKYTLNKAMYLIDESGLKQKNGLQEKGFYASILSQSASFSIKTDSIIFNNRNMEFGFYGTQRIERKSSILKRKLITKGKIRKVMRTINNPHGLIITDYKTLLNSDIDYKPKRRL